MFLIDNNLSPTLKRKLRPSFPGMQHVSDVSLEGRDDGTVWNYAQKQGLHILTKDFDFVRFVNFYGFPPKVVRLDCGNTTTGHIAEILFREEETIKKFLTDDRFGILELS